MKTLKKIGTSLDLGKSYHISAMADSRFPIRDG